MKIVSPTYQSMKRSLRGEEKLWIVFWLWGVTLYLASLIIGFIALFETSIHYSRIGDVVGWLGFALVYIYPFIFIFSIWRCSKNTRHKLFNFGAKLYAVIIFPVIHYYASAAIILASMGLMNAESIK